MATLLLDLAGEDAVDDQILALDVAGEIVLEAAGELEHRFRGDVAAFEQHRVAFPANFDPAEQVGLRAGHAEQPRRIELRAGPEDLRIGVEAHPGPASVLHTANGFKPARG